MDHQLITFNIMSINYNKQTMLISEYEPKPGGTKPKYPLAMLEDVNYPNVEWSIQYVKGSIVDKVSTSSTGYSALQVEILLKRKALTTVNIMILPGTMICLQSFNTFFIRINDPLRIQFAISTLLTLILFLVMVIKFLPIQSEQALIETFFTNLTLTVFSIQLFVLIS